MYKEPIFLQPVFKEKIWGGAKLKDYFDYNIPSNTTGECWGISAHKNGPSTVKNGPLKGKQLNHVWNENKELFGNESGEIFPLLVKILDANQDLSVQVHPDNQYAKIYENGELGKTECWYIIDCETNAEIILGHKALTKEEFISKVENEQWDQLLNKISIKPGDFFYVPSGTIHAIGKGALILEIQQSSDTTYRVYDYDRIDTRGNSRELHIRQSIEVTNIPHKTGYFKKTTLIEEDLKSQKLISNQFFTVFHCYLKGTAKKKNEQNYLLISVLNGEGYIHVDDQSYSFKKGDHFIIPAIVTEYTLDGTAEFILSHTT